MKLPALGYDLEAILIYNHYLDYLPPNTVLSVFYYNSQVVRVTGIYASSFGIGTSTLECSLLSIKLLEVIRSIVQKTVEF